MRSVLCNWLMAILVACAGLAAHVGMAEAQPQAAPGIEGKWSGTLSQAGDKVGVVVEIHRGTDGRLAGSITGLDQDNAFGIDAIEQDGTAVRLVVGAASGGFEGAVSADGTKLSGRWSQLAIATPLELVRVPPSQSPPAR